KKAVMFLTVLSVSLAGLVQRCVIIQKDENGFGLTVSGDNPVFVQLVKEDGAAQRAGVQTGDRIIKVNGTLVTHSNHIEVVKLIKSGSYVALTVLGRPPGLAQIPLPEAEPEMLGVSLSSPNSPATERPYSPQDRLSDENSIVCNQKADILQRMLSKEQQELQAMKEEYSRNPSPKLLKDIQEAKKHIPQLQGQLFKATGTTQVPANSQIHPLSRTFGPGSPDSLCQRESSFPSPKSTPRNSYNSCHSPETEDVTDLVPKTTKPCFPGKEIRDNSPVLVVFFQTNGQCNSFNSIEQLKSRPAHLAAFLHHVISQFDPAPVLCYLYADLYKQTNSKETRRVFMDLHSFFIDRGANLKVPVPESVSSDLDRRRTELIPEEINRQHVQTLQDSLLPDIQKNLEDFRQKRSMGLTVAEVELSRLDQERIRDRVTLERERSYAENIIIKIDDVLLTTQTTEEEKCTTMQYVIYTYMKHLGVRVKEPRSLEAKRVRISFLPKIKKSIKTEKEGEEKVKKPRFPSILGPQRRPSRIEAASGEFGSFTSGEKNSSTDPRALSNFSRHFSPCSVGKALDGRPRPQKQLSDGLQSDPLDGLPYPASHFDLYSLDQLQEDDRESDRLEGMGAADVHSEDDQGTDSEHDPPNWQQLVGREVLAGLRPHEIKRQEVINELFYTERTHVRMLRVLDHLFYQRLTKEGILPAADIKNIFTNLEEIVQLHVSILEQMVAVRKRNESSVIDQIGDDLLSWFSGGEEEKIKQAVGTFCSNQPFALEIIKTKQKKDSRFTSFIQEAESNRLCRRLQLKDIIPVEMLRLTKYPLLLDNIVKYTDNTVEKDKVKQAADCCRNILSHVNQAVKESEDKQRLEDYQRRLDLSSLKQTDNPMIQELKNLDLTKRSMVHEGPLSWKVNKDKTIELYTLLLEDILVLLQKQDERLILKCHSKNLAGTADTKHIFSPIIKLNTVLVRSVATDNKSFFVLSMSENGAQIYELMAPTVSDQRTWQRLITQRADTMKVKPHSVIPLPQTEYAPLHISCDVFSVLGLVTNLQSHPCDSGDRDGVEMITAGVSRLSRDPDRTSTGSTHSQKRPDTRRRFHSELTSSFPLPVAALKQVLVTQLMSQEAAEQSKRSTGARLLRTTSLRTPIDSRARVMVHNGSEKTSSQTEDLTQDLGSGDTGFFDSPEDYGERRQPYGVMLYCMLVSFCSFIPKFI
uniref:Rho guanine nucleotide exchange factor (GEF) 12a n=1 Tax=Salarias fasciatus TaxID=181472 RepID=A0A672HCU6_SALFA